MKKLTTEAISLCKQIAEKYRKKLTHGDWFYDEKSKTVHLFQRNKTRVGGKILTLIHPTGELPDIRCFHWFPLWTISDCLEFFEKIGLNQEFHFKRFNNGNWSFSAEDNKYRKIRGEGETKKDACLKAVLAVLEERVA